MNGLKDPKIGDKVIYSPGIDDEDNGYVSAISDYGIEIRWNNGQVGTFLKAMVLRGLTPIRFPN